MPRSRLTKLALMNHSRARPPMRPTLPRSPSLATPTTRVLSTSGAMIIFTSRRKMSVRMEMWSLKAAMEPSSGKAAR